MIYFTKSHHDLEYEEKVSIYKLFQDFKNNFLEEGVSFFDPNIKLFEDESIFEDFENRIIKGYDSSNNNSLDKYSKQLEDASMKTRHFFANLTWLYNFPIRNESKGRQTKINETAIFLNIKETTSIETKIASNGILNFGNLFHSKYADINFIYFFVKHYIQTKEDFNKIINNIDINTLIEEISSTNKLNKSTLPSKHILNYLFNPSYYEPIGSREDKRKVVASFMGDYDDSTLDEDLHTIRLSNNLEDSNSLFYNGREFEGKLKKRKKKKEYSLKKAFLNKSKSNKKQFQFNCNKKSDKFDFDKLSSDYENKIKKGLEAEELVLEYEKEVVNKSDLTNLINKIDKFNSIGIIASNIDKIMHYSKNIYMYSPFDIISCRNKSILYIEVKSTTNDTIFMSRNELIFAYENFDNYEVRVVKDKEIFKFDLDKNTLEDIYKSLHNESWLVENISLKLNFL